MNIITGYNTYWILCSIRFTLECMITYTTYLILVRVVVGGTLGERGEVV